MALLTRTEEMLLLTVCKLRDDASGIAIREHLVSVTGRSWSIGAVYVPLDKLVKLGCIRSLQAPPTPERGGRSKRYFNVTRQGLAALNEIRLIHDAMWAGLPNLAPGLT